MPQTKTAAPAPSLTALSLFCDDARMEVGGRMILIGQYLADLFLASPAASVDRMTVATFARWPRACAVRSLVLRVEAQGFPAVLHDMRASLAMAARAEPEVSHLTAQAVTYLRFPPLRAGDVLRCHLIADGAAIPSGELYVRSARPPAAAPSLSETAAVTRH